MRSLGVAALLSAIFATPAGADSATATGEERGERAKSAGEEPASLSCGWPNRGALHAPVRLAVEGEAHVVPAPWRARGLHFGTAELVSLIERAARKVAEAHPGSILGVADLSRRSGGIVPRHLSHQAGRDADLIYYAIDEASGEAMEPDDTMPYYRRSGRASYARSPEWEPEITPRRFDTERNWTLVKALLTDDQAEVIKLYVSRRIRGWLLAHGRKIGEPEELIERAEKVLRQPTSADPHNDHMHVRIACADRDQELGRCRDDSTRAPRRGRKWKGFRRCPPP